VTLGQHLAAVVRSIRRQLRSAAFTFACLPYEAFFSLDAVVRAGLADADHAQATARMESVERLGSQSRTDLVGSYRTMWIAPVMATPRQSSDGVEAGRARRGGPILGLWFASPAIAWWISRPLLAAEQG
jgi:cyclic beta-1,2-glucan synthetase